MTGIITESNDIALDSLLEKVYQEGGYDFRGYKHGTVIRRLARRLQAAGARTYLDYMRFLDAHPEEYQRLAEGLTIKTSGFFRSPDTFQQLARLVLPELIAYKRKQGEQRLKVWSAACAQGEEPYSIAILLADYLGPALSDFNVSVCATDISSRALAVAQVGAYSAKDVAALDSTMLERYFTLNGAYYMVKPEIRQMVNFSYFNLATTNWPAVAEFDGIFCCNVLIYLQKALQEKVLHMLHNSLAAPGYLVLGEVETLPESLRDKLECLDTKAKIYRKK